MIDCIFPKVAKGGRTCVEGNKQTNNKYLLWSQGAQTVANTFARKALQINCGRQTGYAACKESTGFPLAARWLESLAVLISRPDQGRGLPNTLIL